MQKPGRNTRTAWFAATAAALMMLAGTTLAGGDGNAKAYVKGVADPGLSWGACPEFMPEGCEIAVLQGDPAEPGADIYFRLPAGTTAPRHWHHSAERMVLVAGTMTVDYDGQDPVRITVGDYAYGPPELPHSATCSSGDDCVLFVAFEAPVDAIAVED